MYGFCSSKNLPQWLPQWGRRLPIPGVSFHMPIKLMICLFSILILGGCTSSVTDVESDAESKSSDLSENAEPVDCNESGENCACQLPDGRKILHRFKVELFQSHQASCGLTCAQQSREAICDNGSLVRSPGFDFLTCEEAECSACELPWGEQLAEGASMDVYQESEVGCTESCKRATVRCSEGRLLGANLRSYSHPSCRVLDCKDCMTPWGDRVADGASIRGYSQGSAQCGERCTKLDLNMKCKAGSFDPVEIATFKYASCVQEDCIQCQTPWGTIIPNLRQVPAFKKATVPCGESCLDNNNVTSRVCVDGALTGPENYRFANCMSQNCDEGGGAPGFVCRLPWSKASILPGTQVSAYTKESVGCDDNCDNYRVSRKCRLEDGLLDGHPGAIYRSCTRDCR